MSRFLKYSDIMDGVFVPHVEASVSGSSMTIPGQGQDLAQIISSIVKLPPLDERTFDVPTGEEPDLRSLAVKTDLDGLYTPEGVNLAEDAKARKKAKEEQKKLEEETRAKEGDSRTPDDK